MNTIDFCYWLQGYFELSGSKELDAEKTEIVKNHLNLVFKHEIDPLRESQTTASNAHLNNAHDGKLPPGKNDMLVRC